MIFIQKYYIISVLFIDIGGNYGRSTNWKSFKGNYYFVENIAYDSETTERIVVYKPLYERADKRQLWVRPEKMFLSEIPIDRPDNITGQKHRFEIVQDIERDYLK